MEAIMPKAMLSIAAVTCAFIIGRVSAQDVQPTCKMCPGTYVSAEEFKEYLRVPSVDQQVRSVDVGKANVQVAIAHRGKLDKPGGVAEHSLVTEVYYVISGSGTNITGPELVNPEQRPATNNAVRMLNGPGHNATAIRNGVTQQLKVGDVLVIPAGTGHQFTRIDDHITYVMIRVDPDKVVPLMDETASKTYLAGRR
jgi:mannose-6-phosphate isomerase-like protein (cupin superfamily)